ncbi:MULTISPECIES: nuclear transport factor 2 family protein [unclassified Actinopolyspora]|uniref:nuclear transport factor 2 family protein n=1 Tax=unclassified Actinopolyspora TaxID=2639451 RepID=UPI0013F672AC|nr:MULTISPECIES: nuclear transport factor 2 family protein [unclassified Actinopolyspora]NHD19331.1 nuclear transport factor 2 family protein [Actinopolyspora sp. BKK2]NHE78455.1 nuclear transport factor 2 family protein [Actinopolyspora sp. BKK1]
MTEQAEVAISYASAELYQQIQQFYAWQMGLMDDREPECWAETFTEDAVFQEAARMEPLHGREAIRNSARETVDRVSAAHVQIRHWLGMLQVHPQSDGSVRARSYALVMRTPKGGDLDVFVSVVCRDHLVPVGDGWQVRHRDLAHDASGGDPR